MLLNRREYLRVGDAELLAGQGRTEACVQENRSRTLRRGDRHRSRGAVAEQAFRWVEARDVVQEPGQASFARIGAAAGRQQLGAASDSNAMRVPVLLADRRAYA